MMVAVYYFTGGGHSLAVAEFFAGQLCCTMTEIRDGAITDNGADTAVTVFPVYCQNIPPPVRRFLQRLTSRYVVLVATYGKISYGNVLFEAARLVKGQVIAGAVVPTGHTFLREGTYTDIQRLMPIMERITDPKAVQIPRSSKNIFANVFPALRSRIGVKIIKTGACRSCNVCETVCPVGGIRMGVTNSGCIRCMRCVSVCPHDALHHKNRWILEKYLNMKRKDEYGIYL